MSDRLKAAMRRTSPQLDMPKPGSTWELFAGQRLDDIEEDLKSIRNRIDTLLWSIVAALTFAVLRYLVDLL